MNARAMYKHLVAPGKPQLAIRSSNDSLRYQLHSRAAISTNLRVSVRLVPGPALRRTVSSASLNRNTRKREARQEALFSVGKAFGALGIGLAIYDIHDKMIIWPREIRGDLKVAVRAQEKEDWKTAADHFERAYNTAVTLPKPVASFGPDYVIKISAIALSLADVLESAGDLPKAYSVYGTAFADLTRGRPPPSEPMTALEADLQRRAIGTALKMAELGERILPTPAPLCKAPADADYGPKDAREVEEKFNWALTEALRLRTASVESPDKGKEKEGDTLNLPRWAKEVDFMSIMARVADYYSRNGMIEYAIPLHLYALSTLFPSRELFLGRPFSSIPPIDVVISFNVGVLSEMSSEHGKARAYYQHALEVSKAIGMDEEALKAQSALKRLESLSRSTLKGEEAFLKGRLPC